MFELPGYTTIVVCQDGSEFGIFCYGGFEAKYRSMFPIRLSDREQVHDSAAEALSHLNRVWMGEHGYTDANALMLQRMRQTIHAETSQMLV